MLNTDSTTDLEEERDSFGRDERVRNANARLSYCTLKVFHLWRKMIKFILFLCIMGYGCAIL